MSAASGERVLGMSVELFGAIGQWVGGIGAIAAAVVAVWIAIRDGRHRADERRDAEAAQARTVLAEVRYDRRPTTSPYGSSLAWGAYVDNHGIHPVTDLVVEKVVAEHAGKRYDNLIAGNTALVDEAGEPRVVARVLPPDGVFGTDGIGFATPDGRVVNPSDIPGATYTVTFSFTDANGLRWRRTGTEPPVRVLS